MSLAATPPDRPTLMEGARLALMEPYLDSLLKHALARGDEALLVPFANIQKFGALNQRMVQELCQRYRESGWSVRVRSERASIPSGLLFEHGDRQRSSASQPSANEPCEPESAPDNDSALSSSTDEEAMNSQSQAQSQADHSGASNGDKDDQRQDKAEAREATE